MVNDVRRALDDGILALVQVGNNVDDWCERMVQDGTYVDHTFMEMSARILNSDIVVVSLHGNASGPCHVIRAGLLDGRQGKAKPGKNVPIFVGYFDDDKHTAGHFQSIMPFRDSEILNMVNSEGGVDVAERLNLHRPAVIDRLCWPHCSPSQLARMSPSHLRLLLLPSVPCPRRSAFHSLTHSPVPDVASKPS